MKINFNVILAVGAISIMLLGYIFGDYVGFVYDTHQAKKAFQAQQAESQKRFDKEMAELNEKLVQGQRDLEEMVDLKEKWDATTKRIEEIQQLALKEQEKLDTMARQFAQCMGDVGHAETCEKIILEVHGE